MGFLTVPLMQEAARRFTDALTRVWPQAAPSSTAPAPTPGGTRQGSPSFPFTLHELTSLPAYWSMNILGWSYCLLPFCVYEADKGWTAWRSWGYIGHVLPLGLLAVAVGINSVAAPSSNPKGDKGQARESLRQSTTGNSRQVGEKESKSD